MIFPIRLRLRRGPAQIPTPDASAYKVDHWDDAAGRECGVGLQRGDEFWLKVHNLGAFAARLNDGEVIGFPDEGVDPNSFHDAFFHGVIPWILQRQQWDCFHGSAVLINGSVIAFCGGSGRGKSTFARAWCEIGASHYSDDTVAFLIRDGQAMAARLPQRPRLREPAASRYATYPCRGEGFVGGELVCDLEATLRPLRAIYLLEAKSDSEPGFVVAVDRIPGPEAFGVLVGEARLLFLHDAQRDRKWVSNYLSLVGAVPVFRVVYALGLDLLPAVLERLDQLQRGLLPHV